MSQHDINQRPVKHHKPLRQCHFCVRMNLAIGDMAETIALCRDNPPARGAKAGIKTEDDQLIFSITASLIS